MITEVSWRLPVSDVYIASASVDLLGEILGGPERPKFQRGVPIIPPSAMPSELITNQDFERFMRRPDRTRSMSAPCSRIPPSLPMSMSRKMLFQALRGAWLYRRRKSSGVSLLLN